MGYFGTRTHKAWANMIQRCTNPKNNSYPDYGGRGIEVCERWRSFPDFLADMGQCPDSYTIDRIDSNAGYAPDNCRWIPRSEQNKNRGNVHRIEGKTFVEWADVLGIKAHTLYVRFRRSPERLIQSLKEYHERNSPQQ